MYEGNALWFCLTCDQYAQHRGEENPFGKFNVYDIRLPSVAQGGYNDTYLEVFMNSEKTKQALGITLQNPWEMCNHDIWHKIAPLDWFKG